MAKPELKRKHKRWSDSLVRLSIDRPDEPDGLWEIKLELEDVLRIEWEACGVDSREEALEQLKERLAALFP